MTRITTGILLCAIAAVWLVVATLDAISRS